MNESSHTELLIEEKRPASHNLVAIVAAVLVTALLIGGYMYLRRRHSQQMGSVAAQIQPPSDNVPKGPAQAHILVDDALLKAGQTIIGGTVRNISNEKLAGLSVGLELRRRKDATIEQINVPVEPTELEPAQEGRYTLKAPAQEYGSVRLVSLRTGDGTLVAYSAASGLKRPPERLEPKVVTVPRPASKTGEFLNSPDNPARVP